MGKNIVNGPIQCRNHEYLSIKNKSLSINYDMKGVDVKR